MTDAKPKAKRRRSKPRKIKKLTEGKLLKLLREQFMHPDSRPGAKKGKNVDL